MVAGSIPASGQVAVGFQPRFDGFLQNIEQRIRLDALELAIKGCPLKAFAKSVRMRVLSGERGTVGRWVADGQRRRPPLAFAR